ncbi:MAG: sigma-54 dependent transcriptional regulator [Planctomycetota bacterium]
MSTKVLIVDDKQMMRDSVGATLQRAGYTVVAASNGEVALRMVAKHRPAAVVTDLKMPEMDGLELLQRLAQSDDQLPVVLMTAYGSINDAVSAMKAGAFDFVQKPFEGDQLKMVVRRAVEHRRLLMENANRNAEKKSGGGPESPHLVGKSPAMRNVAQQIHQIANSTGTVLIQGESGTGKEVVARTIHAHSPRHDRIMLCLNCAALSSSLLESELFGHEKGAFTGADQLRKGRFELADGGTLLLDEISEISPTLQAKLLRVLQEGQFERVGSSITMQVDVRVIATTNRDLSLSVADGTFRQDLYYRLNVLPIPLPPLSQRGDDIVLLANHFLQQVGLREGKEAKRLDDEAKALLAGYHWPGNVRELQNICERASVLSKGQVISGGLIQPWLLTLPSGTPGSVPVSSAPLTRPSPPMSVLGAGAVMGSPPLQTASMGGVRSSMPELAEPVSVSAGVGTMEQSVRPLEEVERDRIVHALGQFNGNRTRTAEALGIGVRTLGLKLKKWKEQNLVAQTI